MCAKLTNAQVCSLHAEVYKLRVNEVTHRSSSGSTYLRRISNDRSKVGGGDPSLYRYGENLYGEQQMDDRSTSHQKVTSTPPIPRVTTGDGSEVIDNSVLPFEEQGSGDGDGGGGVGSIQDLVDSRNRENIGATAPVDRINSGIREDNNIPLTTNGGRTSFTNKRSPMEDQLAELLATRELLKSARRRPLPDSLPLSQMENPYKSADIS
jgi:hypothetical protein